MMTHLCLPQMFLLKGLVNSELTGLIVMGRENGD